MRGFYLFIRGFFFDGFYLFIRGFFDGVIKEVRIENLEFNIVQTVKGLTS
jgi:hypothetical protein